MPLTFNILLLLTLDFLKFLGDVTAPGSYGFVEAEGDIVVLDCGKFTGAAVPELRVLVHAPHAGFILDETVPALLYLLQRTGR